MPNKHYCQGPDCHTKSTKDRWQKSPGKLRGRYASHEIGTSRYHPSFEIFCSQTCANEWLNNHVQDIANRRPIPFITERRVAEGTYGIRENGNNYYRYKTLQRIDIADDIG